MLPWKLNFLAWAELWRGVKIWLEWEMGEGGCRRRSKVAEGGRWRWSVVRQKGRQRLFWTIGQSDSTLCAQASMIISKHRLDFNRPAFVFFIPSIALGKPSNTTLRILSVKGGGVPPKSVTPFLPKKIHKWGGRGTPQIRNLFFWTKIRCFLSKKHKF